MNVFATSKTRIIIQLPASFFNMSIKSVIVTEGHKAGAGRASTTDGLSLNEHSLTQKVSQSASQKPGDGSTNILRPNLRLAGKSSQITL